MLKSKRSGDFRILNDNTVQIRKAFPLDIEHLSALESSLNEWNSEEDKQAYKNL